MVTCAPLTATLITSATALWPLTVAPLPEYVTVTSRVKEVWEISSSSEDPALSKLVVTAPSSALVVTVRI